MIDQEQLNDANCHLTKVLTWSHNTALFPYHDNKNLATVNKNKNIK